VGRVEGDDVISRAEAAKISVILLALQQHLLETRGVDAHEVETLRRDLVDRCCQSDQNVAAAAMCAALRLELELVDKARPGLPLR
jgi:hypothetical protein